MDSHELIAHLSTEGDRLADAAERAGGSTVVPSCPGWSVRDLVAHVGSTQRWATGVVSADSDVRPDPPDGLSDAGLIEWLRAGHRELVRALQAAPADLEAMTMWPGLSPRLFWCRRQAHETAIHRADAEAATGTRSDYPPDFAADGIDELVLGLLSVRSKGVRTERPVTIAVVPDDHPERWLLTLTPERISATAGTSAQLAGADVTAAASAAQLYLWLWNRVEPGRDSVRITGDAEVAALWQRIRVRTG